MGFCIGSFELSLQNVLGRPINNAGPKFCQIIFTGPNIASQSINQFPLCAHLSFYLSINLSIYLSIYLSISLIFVIIVTDDEERERERVRKLGIYIGSYIYLEKSIIIFTIYAFDEAYVYTNIP